MSKLKKILELKRKLKEEIKECGKNNGDDLRRTGPEDPLYFSCTQDHEIDYLVRKFKEKGYDEISILKAIKHCCCESEERKRNEFEECMKNNLFKMI
ncbi:hypothetical protein [Persephonella sp.]